MFKPLLAVALLSGVASAQVASSVEEAQEQAVVKCSEGCLVLSPQEIASIEESMQEAIQEAYQAGLRGWSTVALQKAR